MQFVLTPAAPHCLKTGVVCGCMGVVGGGSDEADRNVSVWVWVLVNIVWVLVIVECCLVLIVRVFCNFI